MNIVGKKFFNNIEDCVDESLRGFVNLYPGLRYHEPYRFVTKYKNEVTDHVAIISGGGSGHEPFCTGYVGDGMLAGAIAGNIFASPPKSHIMQAIRYLHKFYKGGVLVIIPNYTGDRLNFGMAVESAKNENLKVESIAIGEDCASMNNPIIGRRGMCGLLFTYKIAGALSAKGKTLNEILETINRVLVNMSTLGLSSQPCSLPGQNPLFTISTNEMELGTGVHGEAGIRKIIFNSANTAVSDVLDELLKSLDVNETTLSIAVLVNNLGTMTELEQNIICNEVYTQLLHKRFIVERMYAGMLMTSLDMAGFQISILKLPNDIKEYWLHLLDNETNAPRWTGSKMTVSIRNTYQSDIYYDTINKSNIESKLELSETEEILFKNCLFAASMSVIKNESKLNELDSGCGDGDCGSTLKCLAEGIQEILISYSFKNPANILQNLADIAESRMGGTSGAIYSIFFSSMKQHIINSTSDNLSSVWANAWLEAVKTIKKYGGAVEGDRTIVDALEPAANKFAENIYGNHTLKHAIHEAVAEATKGCDKTKYMKARAGRASYVHENHIIDVDAGAFGFVLCLNAISACF